jgi:hypothetical protein
LITPAAAGTSHRLSGREDVWRQDPQAASHLPELFPNLERNPPQINTEEHRSERTGAAG